MLKATLKIEFLKLVILVVVCMAYYNSVTVMLLSAAEVSDQQILDEALAILNGKPVSNVDILCMMPLSVCCACIAAVNDNISFCNPLSLIPDFFNQPIFSCL